MRFYCIACLESKAVVYETYFPSVVEIKILFLHVTVLYILTYSIKQYDNVKYTCNMYMY